MNIRAALKSGLEFKRPHWTDTIQYYAAGSGPYNNLVGCSYIVIRDGVDEDFSTSLDLYPEDIFANDYVIGANLEPHA